ncbi:putative hemolysin [Proteus hauseri]|uniref:putative hemolysin n=1 Tax=Proteus hauseri TaxID=183417 RepID=UPI0032DBCC0D
MQKKFKVVCYLIMFTSVAFLTGCASSVDKPNTTTQAVSKSRTIPTTSLDIPLAESAKATCVFSGGIPSLNYELHGGQTPVCQFANGKRCSEQALIDGVCIPG